MNLTVAESLKYYKKLDTALKNHRDVETIIFPTNLALHTLHEAIKKDKSHIALGAQNMYFQDEGAFTGEVSGPMLKPLVEYVLIGHSERRHKFSERDAVMSRKVSAAVRNGLIPILCVGETHLERINSETNLVLHDQISHGLSMLTSREVAEVVIAYEPVWAIGTGDIATPDIVTAAFKTIRHNVEELYGKKTAESMMVLYGGSVKPEFVADYLTIDDLDGFLVGGASLNDHEFADIVEIVHGKDEK